ncbi:hypothetical protein GKA54_24490 [Vibrio parahaemolyticus]|uniref:hypothetical protein n=2 Tax=Vibrio parahaemolyticus TaxID=670 RepID=UPI00061AEBC9|nr:hypothetical protein [Vibrio parahaemolyticus]EGQ8146420.1 hypothetical protein [Vibrio parahaemolyticus]EGQ8340231.1 hypothetical protein [Vibrio parahaemolyticus]EGQ8372939.1 hypothetical protein [Vibrio parahaemolyticus]EGQ8725122.1 hypothetical protein [Vibrio parahaemolyticus]EGQ8764398.1 hypothetical protein [Vibrio parahaemolyticus]
MGANKDQENKLDDDFLKALAQDVAEKTLSKAKKRYYIAVFLLSILASIGSSVISAIITAETNSKYMKLDFSDRLKMLEVSTDRTEKIQQEIRSVFADDLEAKKLLRLKYEELYTYTLEYVDELKGNQQIALANIEKRNPRFDFSDSIFQKIRMLQSLYFPELENDFQKFRGYHLRYHINLYEISKKSKKELNQSSLLLNDNYELQQEAINSLDNLRGSLISSYADKLSL